MKVKINIWRGSIFMWILVACFGCNDLSGDSERKASNEKLIETIKKGKDFRMLQESQKIKMDKLNDETFKLSSVNREMIDANIASCNSEEDFIRLYTKAGMKNADEYFKLITDQIAFVSEIVKKYPQLKSLDDSEKSRIFDKLFTINDTTVTTHIQAKISSNRKTYIP